MPEPPVPSSETDPLPVSDAPASPGGVDAIRAALRSLPPTPGVYRMLDARGDVLYVGKARDLKRRVTSYTQIARLPIRLQRMVAATVALEIITTHTEAEALLLESNLIKQLKPRYNILLRDDKSFPYIEITGDHPFPRVVKTRGGRPKGGDHFGPFASAGAVNQTLTVLQKAFLLRTCADSVFSGRTRPCLLFQIKRCAGPCVGRIPEDRYRALVDQARAFLSGESTALQRDLARRMDEAAERLEYEQAAIFRDRIKALTNVQAHQDINLPTLGEADVIGLAQQGGLTCVQVFFFRGGRNNGNRPFFPSQAGEDAGPEEVLEAFLGQFYARMPPPREVLIDRPIPHQALVEQALSLRAGHKVTLVAPQRGPRRKLIEHAGLNAREALGRRLAESTAQRRLLEGLADLFGLPAPPERVEVYDNSHIAGSHPVGAMIVAGPEGFQKAAYRKFNIKSTSITPGDDYAMLREVLTRRFARARAEDPDRTRGQWPDLVLIDGGQGQVAIAAQVLEDQGITDLPLVGVAKGPDRDAGRERLFPLDRPSFVLPPNDPVLYFIQRLRDEAHRFAIGSHRTRRSKAIAGSPLDAVPGIGATRKKALLRHFGSAREVARAGLADLAAVEGISAQLARTIYDHFHGGGATG